MNIGWQRDWLQRKKNSGCTENHKWLQTYTQYIHCTIIPEEVGHRHPVSPSASPPQSCTCCESRAVWRERRTRYSLRCCSDRPSSRSWSDETDCPCRGRRERGLSLYHSLGPGRLQVYQLSPVAGTLWLGLLLHDTTWVNTMGALLEPVGPL